MGIGTIWELASLKQLALPFLVLVRVAVAIGPHKGMGVFTVHAGSRYYSDWESELR